MSWNWIHWKRNRDFARREAIAQAVLEAVSDVEARVALLERVVLTVSDAPSVDSILQDAADHNRENAHEKFGDVLFSRDGEWYETATGERVLFTPYGWRRAADVKEYIHPDSPDIPVNGFPVYHSDEQLDFGELDVR